MIPYKTKIYTLLMYIIKIEVICRFDAACGH